MRSLCLLAFAACASSAPAAQPAPPAASPEHAHGHGHMPHRFEKAEEWVPQFDAPDRDQWQRPDDVVAALAIQPGMTVVDLGAGTGYFEKRLSAAVGASGKVIALDTEPDMIYYMTKRAEREQTSNVEPRQAGFSDPKLDAASVDRILIVNTWHHIEKREAYAKKLAAALKPGGFVLVVDFKLESAKGPPKQYKLAPAQIIEELAPAGFKAAVVDVGLLEQYVVKATL